MNIVSVVYGVATAEEKMKMGMDFVNKIGKRPKPIRHEDNDDGRRKED